MRIRQLARCAAVIAAAATAMLGFSSGIAGATPAIQATPAMRNCRPAHACAYELSPHGGLALVAQLPCRHGGILFDPPLPLFQVTNQCSTRVWVHDTGGGAHCVNPHTTSGGVGRFGNLDKDMQVSVNRHRCPPGTT
jgi:hypothetical protein